MIPIGKKYGLGSIFALTKAEDVWRAVEKCLYSDGRTIHFSKRGELPAILDYLSQPERMDSKAVQVFKEDEICISTYRPCYATLVCKKIRGKLRVYVHITVEGLPKPKRDRYGNLKHRLGKGMIGCDIGTQTIAYTSDSEVGLKNLAERGSSISTNERKERLLYRAMDRSRRATNPQNYNDDGTIKKGRKTWNYSNKYKKRKAKHTELCRINAINRKLAIKEDVNHLRSLGDTFVTEPKNAKKLQRRAKNTTINEKGKCKRKKRFGKSIKNRCCGYFQAQIEQKFKNTNGIYIEVPFEYRASQYDHTANAYIVEIQKTIANVVGGLLDCKVRCSNRKTVFQSLCMMYDYSKMLSVRTPQACLWE